MENQTPKKKSKKVRNIILISIAALVLIIIIANIGGNDENTEANTSTNTTKTDTEYSIKTSIESGYFMYSVNGFKFLKTINGNYYSKTANGTYLTVLLNIKNISKETRLLDGSCFYVTDNNGIKYEHSTDGSTAWSMIGGEPETLFLKQIQPNIPTDGVLVFEVPEEGEYNLHLGGKMFGGKTVRVALR